MSINKSVCEQELLISKLSVISFILAVLSYAILISVLIFKTSLKKMNNAVFVNGNTYLST